MNDDLEPAPRFDGRVIDAKLHLFDRQVLDADGVPLTAVDDVEISDVPLDQELTGTDAPTLVALLDGPVLGTRLFGGEPPASRWERIAWRHVTEVGTALHLDAPGSEFDSSWAERWVRDHMIARIPGGRHDPD